MNGSKVSGDLVVLQTRLVTRFYPQCEHIWLHAERAGILVEKCRETITELITEAMEKSDTDNVLANAAVHVCALNAAGEICDRLEGE